jgi:hypothetical protein
MATRREMLEELIGRARSDPEFFHHLVFKPEAILGKLEFLGRREKGMILTIAAEDVIAGLAGLAVNLGGGVAECGNTCMWTDCTDTCNVTCQVTNRFESPGDVTNQAGAAFEGGRRFFQPVQRTRDNG